MRYKSRLDARADGDWQWLKSITSCCWSATRSSISSRSRALLRARTRIGLGAFFCALGVMHFLETYLASIFYVALPFGIVTSPGSTVLFTGKLMLLLLLYIREDAVVVRQPIYGLLFGNVLLFALAFVMRQHTLVALAAGRAADFGFLNEMGALMVWGTAILFFDCIIIILLYERSRVWLGDHVLPRLVLCGALVLSFDQVAFFAGLHMLTGAGLPVLIGGWIAKMGAVALYSVLAAVYLKYFERPLGRRTCAAHLGRVRHADLSRALRGPAGAHRLRRADRRARPPFAGILWPPRGRVRRRRRPAAGAAADRHRSLQGVQRPFRPRRRRQDAQAHRAEIMAAARVSDFTYRFGGEEFVVIADGVGGDDAIALGERIRRAIAGAPADDADWRVTVSIGIATCAERRVRLRHAVRGRRQAAL